MDQPVRRSITRTPTAGHPYRDTTVTCMPVEPREWWLRVICQIYLFPASGVNLGFSNLEVLKNLGKWRLPGAFIRTRFTHKANSSVKHLTTYLLVKHYNPVVLVSTYTCGGYGMVGSSYHQSRCWPHAHSASRLPCSRKGSVWRSPLYWDVMHELLTLAHSPRPKHCCSGGSYPTGRVPRVSLV